MKQTLIFFIKIIKKHLKEEFLGLLFSILYTLAIFLSPQVSKFLIDDVLISNDFEKLYYGIGMFFLVCILQPISGYISNRIFFYVSEKVTLSMRKNLLKRLISAPLNFFDKTPKGFIFSRFFNDSRSISDFVTNVFVVFIKDIFLITILLFGMFYLSWKITLFIFAFLFIYTLVNIFVSKRFKAFSKITLSNNDIFHKDFSQSIDNVFLTKIFSLENFYYKKNETNLKTIYSTNIKIGNFSNLVNSFSNVVVVLSLSVIYGFGAVLVFKSETSIGSVVAIGIYFQMLIGPIQEMIGSNTRLQEIIPVVKRLNEYLNLENEPQKLLPAKIEAGQNSNSIIFNKVSFEYSKEVSIAVLKDVTFKFEGNGLYGIFGKSGCGKSTLLKLLMGLYVQNSGEIFVTIDGKPLNFVTELRKEISYISQNFELVNASVADNLRLFQNDITYEDREKICKKLNLHDKIISLKEKYNSVVDEKINLSEGEKQRLCIARAVLKKSSIYIFDEATAFLDKDSENKVCSIIEELASNSIVIMVSHKPNLLKNAKNILVINEGRVIQNGDYNKLTECEGFFNNLISENSISKESVEI